MAKQTPQATEGDTKKKKSLLEKARDTVRKRPKSSQSSTQRFLPIAEIRSDTVILKKGGIRAVLKVEATNFNLKSETEQLGIINGYESFINTINFPIQIVVRSTRLNIDPYIQSLRELAENQDNALLKEQTESYAVFVEKIVEVADIMKKRFYVVIPLDDVVQKKSLLSQFFSWLRVADSKSKASSRLRGFESKAARLAERVMLIESGLQNVGLSTKRMNTRELIELYYSVYNPETSQEQKLSAFDDLNTSPNVL